MKREELAFLLDLKALMEHAILHQQSGTKLDMRFAINHAHHAVELTLRKKAELLGATPYYFPKILKMLKDKDVKIPYERQVVELNKARELTQHYGTTPNENDARRLIFVSKDFLTDFWRDALGVDYDDMSLIDLIENDEIREKLKEAEKEENYEKAVTKSILATYMVSWWIKNGFYEAEPTYGVPIMDVTDHEVQEAFDVILEVALSSPFFYKLWKLRKSCGIVFLHIPREQPILQKSKQVKFTREDASYALELAIEYALWAEQIYG